MKPVPNFKNKLVMIYTAASRHPALLEHATFKTQGGRLFIVGNYPKDYSWLSGVAAGVAWSEVVEYIVFKDMADYRSRETPENPLG